MTVPEDHEDAHGARVEEARENVDSYMDTLEDEIEMVRDIQEELEELPDDECLTREEVEGLFPETTPLESLGTTGF